MLELFWKVPQMTTHEAYYLLKAYSNWTRDFEETSKISEISNCPVVISGGVSSIDDIKKAKNLKNVEGIIVGKAIYDGDIKLEELVKELDA